MVALLETRTWLSCKQQWTTRTSQRICPSRHGREPGPATPEPEPENVPELKQEREGVNNEGESTVTEHRRKQE